MTAITAMNNKPVICNNIEELCIWRDYATSDQSCCSISSSSNCSETTTERERNNLLQQQLARCSTETEQTAMLQRLNILEQLHKRRNALFHELLSVVKGSDAVACVQTAIRGVKFQSDLISAEHINSPADRCIFTGTSERIIKKKKNKKKNKNAWTFTPRLVRGNFVYSGRDDTVECSRIFTMQRRWFRVMQALMFLNTAQGFLREIPKEDKDRQITFMQKLNGAAFLVHLAIQSLSDRSIS